MPDGKNEAKNSTMNLTIDMGNTRVKYAVFDGGTVVSDGCSEEFDEAVIDRILAAHPGITQAIVATTRGPVDDTVALVRRRIGRCLRLSPQLPLPIRNGYTTPETLGEDRLAAAVGAASLYPGRNLLIVDFGTAITIDQVSADGVFRGGNISPGVQMRFRALHDYTAALPLCESCEDQTLLGAFDRRGDPAGRDERHCLRNRGVYRPAVSGNRCVVDNFYRRGCKILC